MNWNNNGLKKGWYHHQVGDRCDNCDKGFFESGGVMNANTLMILCYDCYNIVCYPTPQNKKWIKVNER
jgi:hypothetical protein